jgi:hypothetical protein
VFISEMRKLNMLSWLRGPALGEFCSASVLSFSRQPFPALVEFELNKHLPVHLIQIRTRNTHHTTHHAPGTRRRTDGILFWESLCARLLAMADGSKEFKNSNLSTHRFLLCASVVCAASVRAHTPTNDILLHAAAGLVARRVSWLLAEPNRNGRSEKEL